MEFTIIKEYYKYKNGMSEYAMGTWIDEIECVSLEELVDEIEKEWDE